MCQAWGTLWIAPETRGVTFCASNALIASPFFRLLCRLTGSPSGCDKATMKRLMRKGGDLALIPGGFHEASIHSNTADRVYLASRKGFIKYAIEHGYSLTPCYGFGENKTYANLQGAWKIRMWLNSFGIPAIAPFGRWWCPMLPKSVGLHIVVGAPIPPPAVAPDALTREVVDGHHAKYVAALRALFAEHAPKYGGDELEVW